MTTEDRIRAALNAAADEVHENDLSPAIAPSSHDGVRPRTRWLAPLLAAAAVIAVVAATVAYLGLRDTPHPAPVGNSTPQASSTPPAPSTSVPTTPSVSSSPTKTGDASSTEPTVTPTVPGSNCYFIEFACSVPSGYVYLEPLWPFTSLAQAQQWNPADGHQPWHGDAGETALLFTENYLGFTDVTTVISSTVDANGQAHVTVGYLDGNGGKHTAAVLHLVRYTRTYGDTTAGWEVVGSDDTTFTLEQPAYGSQVVSPMTVGGHITGVDESIQVTVRSASGGATSVPAFPAGGVNSPWSTTVPFTQTGVLTVVASTGGHLIQHELFAIQGVHTG
jgi:hypothetical protein